MIVYFSTMTVMFSMMIDMLKRTMVLMLMSMLMLVLVLVLMLMLVWVGIVMKGGSGEEDVMMILTNLMVVTIIVKLMKMEVGINVQCGNVVFSFVQI